MQVIETKFKLAQQKKKKEVWLAHIKWNDTGVVYRIELRSVGTKAMTMCLLASTSVCSGTPACLPLCSHPQPLSALPTTDCFLSVKQFSSRGRSLSLPLVSNTVSQPGSLSGKKTFSLNVQKCFGLSWITCPLFGWVAMICHTQIISLSLVGMIE